MPHLSPFPQTQSTPGECSLFKFDTYADAILRTLYSFKAPPPPMRFHARRHNRHSYPQSTTVSQSVVNELVNGCSDNLQSLADPSSLSSSSSSLFSSSSTPSLNNTSVNYFTLEARLPLVQNKVEQLEKFKRLLSRLDSVYNSKSNSNNNNNNNTMSTSTLPPPSSHISDRYLFRPPSNDNRASRMSSTTKKNKSTSNPTSSSTPPLSRKRYKFSPSTTDQNNNVYKFSNGNNEPRSHSTDSDRYCFSTDDSSKYAPKNLTFIRSGTGLEPHSVTFIDGASTASDKISMPTTKSIQPTTLTTDTPYLFSKTTDTRPTLQPSHSPEDSWIHQRQQPHIVFDSATDISPNAQLKRPRTASTSPDHRQITKRSPTRMDAITSTNGSLSTIRRSPPNKVQNVRFEPSVTPRSYLDEARERLAGKKRGRSPQAFQQSVDRLISSTNQKYRQQQILSPTIPYQQKPYVSQYYAQEEPPIDYLMDSDDDEQQKHLSYYNRGLNTNRTHTQIMKNVNKSLIDGSYQSNANRLKQLDQNFNRYLRAFENQSLQRELNYDLIRCFSSTYIDDLRREENRNFQTRSNMRAYTYEDIQDIHMPQALESYKMKRAIDRERRLRLSTSFDGQITSSTPTSSLGAGLLSPILSTYSPIMTGSLNENIDAQSGGFETDRRSQKPHTPTTPTPTNLRPGHVAPGPNLDIFFEIMQDRFRGVDASIAGQVSTASKYQKNQARQPATTSQMKPTDHDSDIDIRSNSSLWSDEDDEQQITDDNQRKTIPNQKQLSRYLSSVNRSLLDRPSDVVADFYISQLNRSMKESVRHVENIARDKALVRQVRNREFIEEPTTKLGRSLSAEHLYQVRKEHLRYKHAVTTPTSFTVEDVADIYKPFALENYKRKIAIEVERRRRERQGQLMAGTSTPVGYITEPDFSNAIKVSPPPVIEKPKAIVPERKDRLQNLTRTSITRINEPNITPIANDQQNGVVVVPIPVVQTKKIRTSRARRTITDDGSTDVVHHVGIISPPPSYVVPASIAGPKETLKLADQFDTPHVTIVPPPDFVDRKSVYIRKERAHTNVVDPSAAGVIERAFDNTPHVLYRDADYTPTLQRASEISQPPVIPPPRSPTRIYTPVSSSTVIPRCHANRIETDPGATNLSLAHVEPLVILNQEEIRELSLLADQAQRLQIPPCDYDHAMVILSPDQTQYQHSIGPQPLLFAAAHVDQLHDQPIEQVTRYVDHEILSQHTNLITPIPEHMAKIEQEIPVFENVSTANIQQYTRNRLNEMPVDSGIVSLNTSQASEQPVILSASRINRLDHGDDERLENLREDMYYQQRLHTSNLLRHVEMDPNTNIRAIRSDKINVFESVTNMPATGYKVDYTHIIDGQPYNQIPALQRTDEPIIYETINQNVIGGTPDREYLTSSYVEPDDKVRNRSKENLVQWGKPVPVRPQPPADTHKLQLPPRDTPLNFGETNELQLSRTSSFGSDADLKRQTQNSARIIYDRRDTNSLDNITRPLYQHPPAHTACCQQHRSVDLDEEPMAVHVETSWVTDVSYGRASLTEPIQPLNAPKELIESNLQALLPEELATSTTAVTEQHATQLAENDYLQNRFDRIEHASRVPTVIYDTDWNDQKVKTIPKETPSDLQMAKQNYQPIIEYQQARITQPKPILSRENYEYVDNTPQEIMQPIETKSVPQDRSIERTDTNDRPNFKSPPTEHIITDQKVLCRPLTNHLEQNDDRASSISDDSVPVEHRVTSDIIEPTNLENPILPNALLTLNYAQHNQEINLPWQRAFDNEFSDEYQHLQEQLQIQTEKPITFTDGSILTRDQPHINEKLTTPKSTLRSTSFLNLNYAQDRQERTPPTEHAIDQQYSNQDLQQRAHIQSEHNLPRHLPLITPAVDERALRDSDNFAREFYQTPLLHENVRIETCNKVPLVPATQIDQSKPVYRVRPQQLSPNEHYEHAQLMTVRPTDVDQIETIHANLKPSEISPPDKRPVAVDIEFHVQPTHSDTSSVADMDLSLHRLEETIEPEQHLPLVDQISLSYSTSIRSTCDGTQRAIERYEQKHPFFSRSLPTEWLSPTILPHDEQFVEQWTVEKNLETIQHQVELNTNNECSGFIADAIANDAYSIDERFEEETTNSLNTRTINNEIDNNHIIPGIVVSHCSPTSDYETDSLDKDNDTTSTTTSIGVGNLYTTTPITTTLPSQSTDTEAVIPVDFLLDKLANEKKSKNNLTKDFLLTIGFGQDERNQNEYTHRAKELILEQDDDFLLYNFDEYQQEFLNPFFEPAHFYLPTVNEISVYQISLHNQYSNFSTSNFLQPTIHHDDHLSSNECKTNEQEILSYAQVNHQNDDEDELKSLSCKYDQPSQIENFQVQSTNSISEVINITIDEPPTIIENEDDCSAESVLPDVILSTTTINNEDFIQHEPREVTIITTFPTTEPTSFSPSLNSRDRARQTTQPDEAEQLSEQQYVIINQLTPTPSMRKVRPPRPGQFIEQPPMTETTDFSTTQSTRIPLTTEAHNLHFAASTKRDQTDHLPPTRLPAEPTPDYEHARLVSTATGPKKDLQGEVLIRETVVQHVSEDEKSTSSEEVVFEEWSEEYRCRRTEEYDPDTNRLLCRRIDPIGERKKSDVIKEEYKEKNERIKGHRSYDIVKEVYRRVPANTVDPTRATIISSGRPESPVYEEISQVPPSITSSISPSHKVTTEITPRTRHWSSEDIYTTEIVYDPRTAHDIESMVNTGRLDTRYDATSSPGSSSINYDRVRPGQYTTMMPSAQASISKESTTNYDRISNIIAPSIHVADRRQRQNEDVVSEEYHVEVQKAKTGDDSPLTQYQRSTIGTRQKRFDSSEEDSSDPYVITGDRTYEGLTTIVSEAGRTRDSDWRSKLKQIYSATSDDDQYDQCGKAIDGNYTAQRVTISPNNIQQTFKDTYDNIYSERNQLKTPPSRHAVKEILVSVTRGPPPDKKLHQQIYHLSSSSDDETQKNKRLVRANSLRSRETTKKIITVSRTDDDRPKPPKRSSSSSIIDERRARFEQQQYDTTMDSISNRVDRPGYSRVEELRNAFETTTIPSSPIKDDPSKSKSPISTGLTEQRRRMFEEQEQINKGWTSTNRRPQQVAPTTVVPQRRVYRISGRRANHIIDEFDSQRRISETHTAPSRVSERVSQIESNESKSTDRLNRTGFDTVRTSYEFGTTKSTDQLTVPQSSAEKDKRIISSIDSDLSGASPPIYQSTPKSKQKQDEDAGHESEDELSDPAQKQDQQYDMRRRTPKTRLRDFSQSTSQPIEDTTYVSQRNKSSFTETNMENILSHVPTSKGKGLLIELSPHLCQDVPITSTTTKSARDPYKSITASDSGIFDYSTGTSQRLPTSSSSWHNNASTSVADDAIRTSTVRDSGIYGDSVTTTLSSRYGRRQPSDTDQTTIHGGDDSVSRSTYRYETEIISSDQLNQQKPIQQQPPRAVRRHITGTPPSDYENIANYHSGISSQRKVPITTQSRNIMTRPLVVDEIETIETETRVECQVQRTHEIKESTTTTERSASPGAPKKVITTTTTTTTTTAPFVHSAEPSSDEASRMIPSGKRVLLNDRTNYYDTTKSNASPITIRSQTETTYTPTHEIRQQTRTYSENGFQQQRYDSPQSDSISYQLPTAATTTTTTTKTVIEEEPVRVEETWFKPIQRDRSQDSLLQRSSRSNIRTLSTGPRNVEVTSLSPQSQVTFGKYTPNEIIAIVRVPELSTGNGMRPGSVTSPIRHGTSEPELNARLQQEEEQRSKLHYERIHTNDYRSPTVNQDYQQRQSRSRISPYNTTNEYSTSLAVHPRSSSYHSSLHDQNRQQQEQEQHQCAYHPSSSKSACRRQIQRRTGSLGNLLGPSIEFEIEIEKRPPNFTEQPTVVALDQPSPATVTTSKDGRVSIQNITARPGNTVVINSDFHSSDRSLNRSSGYFSADELRSQGINPNYSSDEQSSGAAINVHINSQSPNTPTSHTRRYRNNDQVGSKLPPHYRTRQNNNNYHQLNNDNFDKLNQIVQRHYRQSNNNVAGFNDTIDQIDALYNNLDVQTNDNYIHENPTSPTTYDFSRSPSNRGTNFAQNTNEYSKRFTSTSYPHTSNDENSSLRHLVSPPIMSTIDKRHNDPNRAHSDNENLNSEYNRNWGSTSLNDLALSTPLRPSQSLSSSGILADYTTPGSISPNSGFGSTQNVILQQNRFNSQGQVVQRNRTSVKQMKQKSAAKKKLGNVQGQYSDEEDDHDSPVDHDSPLMDNYRPQPPARFSNRYQ